MLLAGLLSRSFASVRPALPQAARVAVTQRFYSDKKEGDNAHATSAQIAGHLTTLRLSVSHQPGQLQKALDVFSRNGINLTCLESRPNHRNRSVYDFFVGVDGSYTQERWGQVHKDLQAACAEFTIISDYDVPWFPRRMKDLDEFSNRVLCAGAQLEADHPGFTDPEYRKRREGIAKIAQEYRHGQRIPRVDYTPEEVSAWGVVYNKLTALYPTHACKEHNYIFPLLVENCGYRPNNIPQLQDISDFLKESTGFTIRPVAGLLSSRDFLNGLAFRVFHSTQYIRHHSTPLYTPEPDICHELLGHVPLYADPDFADFSQAIGLASLGVSDEDINKLATCYWFTVEFGLCKQDSQLRAYGAGLLSSFGELEYCRSEKPVLKPFDPFVTGTQSYPITTYQPIYFVAESFNRAKEQMIQFGETLNRPFSVRYNPYTQTIEVLTGSDSISVLANSIGNDARILQSVMKKFTSK